MNSLKNRLRIINLVLLLPALFSPSREYFIWHENYLVQTLGLVLPAGIVAGHRDRHDCAVILRASVLGGGSEVAFGERHALRRLSIFCLLLSVVGLDRREDSP
jgi:hypothetical protein